MKSLVDNFALGNTDSQEAELPRLEALARLYELIERYDGLLVDWGMASAVSAHKRDTGHALRFGCCRTRPLKDLFVGPEGARPGYHPRATR